MAVSTLVMPPPDVISSMGQRKPARCRFTLQIGQIAADHRLKICVGAGRGEPLVFTHLRRDVRRQRDRNVRQRACDRIPDPVLVSWISEAM